MATYNNWNSIETAIRKSMVSAVESATNKTFDKLQEGVDRFYTRGPGMWYIRTFKFQGAPENDGITQSGNSATGKVHINTDIIYEPQGITTEMIYNLAENNALVGLGGFWRDVHNEGQNILNTEMSKHFS